MAMKTYQIEDQGDSFELAMFDGDLQVGGAILPMVLGEDSAHELARILGEAFQSAPGGYPRAPVTNKGKRR